MNYQEQQYSDDMYAADFDYDNTQWDDDDILSVLNEETIVEDFDYETSELLKNF